ncbi:unnamed protein product [Acanthoscelides obtectus]|uniref:Uncharacterized protein n=1 Tax=Acanthoscelides obtectus TaxID=200917 RepID=A0A9P0PXS9_ACAOB|nr:unnamed protein product [Acanthoscelides obtectus]CAK1670418.1 hypothetical protein AOBTE_LOCUS27622 [Acanthoscelides obtectus]
MKLFYFLFVVIMVVLGLQTQVAQACIPNGGVCQANGSAGNCCSGNCYQQAGWANGNCR